MVVSGLAFHKICKWSFDPRYPLNFNYNELKDGDRVFLNLDYFEHFVQQLKTSNLKKKFILFTHNSDKSFTQQHYDIIKDYVYRVYPINNVCENKNVITIPLAFQDYPSNHFKLIVELLLKHKSVEKQHLIYMNFSIQTNPEKRQLCFDTFNKYEWVTKKSGVSKEEFMNDILLSKYVLSPEGTGIDCHRIYEAIACGTIPIIKKSKTAMDTFYRKLPVILVEDWDEITEESLKNDYDIYKKTLDDWLESNKGWIKPEFWIQKLHFVSFGDDKYIRTKMRLKHQAGQSLFFSSINIFGPSDLGSDFAHFDFIRNNPRGYGYWIWKLYFILRVLRTIQYDDILVYTDSGSSVNKNGNTRLQEYLSMLNDDSDKDIMCYQMRHLPEYKYTKNDVFEFFKLDEKYRNSGQIHATVIYIRKTDRIINFLEKMYEINSNNYNLIDDSPSKTQNHPEFIDCRHDQSVFSVMMKQLYEHKAIVEEETWPKNDDWNTISHVPILATRLRY